MGAAACRLVVIGNGMAGIAAVEAVLKAGVPFSITLFGDEPQTHYNRILLSDFLAGKTEQERLFTRPKHWYTERGIEAKLGVSVTAIDPTVKEVTDANGDRTPYDALLIAAGGLPFIPPISGREKNGVFVFRTLQDTEQILAAARSCRRAVVIGGGLLGLEAARGLLNHGLSVTLLHLADRLMEQQLDPAGASLLKREIEGMGIRVLLGSTAEAFLGDERVEGVRLTTGETLPTEMVVLCTGIRPNLALAHQIGLKTNRGILVDDRMETSQPGIFAVGDVIEHRGKTYGLIAPLREQAETLADVLAGKDQRRYTGTVCPTILKVAGIHLTSIGDFLGSAGMEETVFLDTEKGIYKKCVFRQNRLVGAILLGDNKDGPRLFNLIQKGADVSAMKGSLLGNVSLEGSSVTSGVAALAETDLVCNCNNVTKGAILSVIREKGITTRDDIAAATQATTGCGSCTQIVDDLLAEAAQQPTPVAVKKPAGEKMPDKSGPSALKTLDLEKIKQEGLGIDFARLREEGSRALTAEDYYRLKTYGICSQKHPGYFMLRTRIPGGSVTYPQVMALADLAETHGRGWGHLTVRQDLELHWVRVEESLEIFEKLEAIGLTTRSACGHTLRNVMACAHGEIAPDGLFDVRPWAKRITDYFVKRSDLINPNMPNRLNVYFAGCSDCAPDAAINDIGFVAVDRLTDDGRRAFGFELWVGGSLGAHPMLGFKLKEFVSLADALPACQAIFAIHMKFGNRNKAKSRLKYLIEQWGQPRFADLFEKVFLEKRNLPENREALLPAPTDREPRPALLRRLGNAVLPSTRALLSPGAIPQRQHGYARLTIAVPLGEIRAAQLRAVGKISKWYGNGQIHFTKEQEVALHWIPMRVLNRVVRALGRVGLSLKGGGSRLLACPGTEFCTLAVTNAQGSARDLLKHFQPEASEKDALWRSISVHLSGCPNSCVKHQVADIGLAGTMTPVGDLRRFSYQLFLGGKVEGGVRLGVMVRKGITEEAVVPTVDALLDLILENRLSGETFQETVVRLGTDTVAALLEKKIAPLTPAAPEALKMIPDLIQV